MTVKHKTAGRETLTPAHRVTYDERASTLTVFDDLGNITCTFSDGGTAYVTNDAGQTVGIYNLNKK